MNWNKETKFTVKFILILALCAGFYVLGGYNNQVAHKNDGEMAINAEKRLITDMQVTCHASHFSDSGQLEQQCGDLIDQVRSKGFEVMQKDGDFWAEYNPNVKEIR